MGYKILGTSFSACEICGSNTWSIVFSGAVRDGAFGKFSENTAVVAKCGGCGTDRLSEAHCHGDDDFYSSSKYRDLLSAGNTANDFFLAHDTLQLTNLGVLWPESVRGKTVADIGCAAGSFLDHVSGLAAKTIAIEPCEGYHDSLRSRGHAVFSSCEAAIEAGIQNVDYIFSFSVIEHVSNPRSFLADIAAMMAPSSRLLISTPNRRDVLMEMLPEDYQAFFYRTVHRWYFDRESFAECAKHAGLNVVSNRCVHRFGLSNALRWLRDRRPGGTQPLPSVTPVMDSCWQASLEHAGTGDYLYFWLGKPY